MITKLSDMPIGTTAIIEELLCSGLMRRRMLDLGILPGSEIIVTRKSPLGDPRAYSIKGAEIALREEEASQIIVVKK